ncbi:homoserine kinase [Crocosphaera chwakensis]|uniref:Homoserine kinase n=1 Tax=Crocosphaera chwakensis CCY0110 TaxID=391612 RepID=A3IXG7_9CHRO|nr:homoserine kinase [Crocosphaera chwakensis]EAZ88814.1 homoserine kinase [Crocosphaera chwakensis CCY0110]
MSTVTVNVPATTANIGPGFDCIGAALTLYNQFQFTEKPDAETDLSITVTGTEAHRVSRDRKNLLYQAFTHLYHHLNKTPPKIAIDIKLGVPLARGLGSSATAIVGGLVGANELAGQPLSTAEIMELAIALEGHPDNVVPALLGNCQLSVGKPENWEICQIPWHSDIIPVVAIPDFELSTEEARAVLPKTLSYTDAIFNVARMGLLIRALETGNGQWLSKAMADKLHQPYRQGLIEGYEFVQESALKAGAYGMVISGAGPTLLALTHPEKIQAVEKAMKNAWTQLEILADVRSLSLDTQGAKVNVH